MSSPSGDLAVVMTGGGARAAYQVGFLRCVARHFPDLQIDILTGVSAGAINAAFLAAKEGALRDKVDELAHVWGGLHVEQVFRVDALSIVKNLMRWGAHLTSGGAPGAPTVKGLVDTMPLRRLLEKAVPADDRGDVVGIDANVRNGRLKSIAVSAVSYTTGQSVTWVQGRDIETWDRPNRKSVSCRLSVSHVMASSALPLFFPAVEVDGQWYGDGGIRMTSPLSPALHLGARRILAISTRRARTRAEADRPVVTGYPPPAQVAGILLNAIFLDLMDQDAVRLDRMNQLVEALPAERRRGLRRVELLILRPSQDLGQLANLFEVNLPRSFRFLTRGLGTQQMRSNDLLSLLMFQADYVHHLMELGDADAEARLGEIRKFLT